MNARLKWNLVQGLAVVACLAAAWGPADAETVAIVGATVHTMGSAGTLENATVVIEGGRIRAVGRGIPVPPGARTIDARGKVVTPGLFDSLTQLGLVEVNAVAGTRDGVEQNDRITAAFDVADAINPRSMLLPINRVEGLTRAVVAPGAGKSLIAGRGAVIHLGMGPDLLVRSPAALFAVLGEQGARLAGGSRAGAMLLLREALDDALDYATHRAAWEKAEHRLYTLSRLDLEALAPVARGELPLVVFVDRASDIEAALRLGRERHLKLILAGCDEGWMVADQIAAARVPVLINPLADLPSTFEHLGATLENAARLTPGRGDLRLHERRRPQRPKPPPAGRQRGGQRSPLGRGAPRHDREPGPHLAFGRPVRHLGAGQGGRRRNLGRRSAGGDERRREGLHPRRRDAAEDPADRAAGPLHEARRAAAAGVRAAVGLTGGGYWLRWVPRTGDWLREAPEGARPQDQTEPVPAAGTAPTGHRRSVHT